jgi:hypothetical protein
LCTAAEQSRKAAKDGQLRPEQRSQQQRAAQLEVIKEVIAAGRLAQLQHLRGSAWQGWVSDDSRASLISVAQQELQQQQQQQQQQQ